VSDQEDATQTTPEGDERDAVNLPGEGGHEIPVPSRDEFMRNLEKVAKPKDDEDDDPREQ
jgi:hypothetical protein